MKRKYVKQKILPSFFITIFLVLIHFWFNSLLSAADVEETFTAPPGSIWGVLNPEPDEATSIAKSSDGYIVSGYVLPVDPTPNTPGDEKGGYGILYKLDEDGTRIFYRSYYDMGLGESFYCDPGICVTCETVDVSDYSSVVSLYRNHNRYHGICTMVRDVVVSPTPGGEEYVLLGSRLTEFDYEDPSNPFNTLHKYYPGVWLAKTDTNGILTLDEGYADHFPQQLDHNGTPLNPYTSFGTTLTPVRDSSNGSYDFLIGANIDHNAVFYGWLIRTDNIGNIEWEEGETTYPGLWFSARQLPDWEDLGGHGVTQAYETDAGYLVTSDGGVWGLDSTRALFWEYDDGVHGNRSMIKEGTDTVVVTNREDGDETYPALVKIDNTGAELWSTKFDFTEHQCELIKVVRTDYGYVVVGSINTKGYGGLDVWLVAVDVNGNRLWDKTLGGEYNDKGVDLLFVPGVEPEDPDALVVAAIASFDTDDLNGPEAHSWIVKTKDRFYPPVADFSYDPEAVIIEQQIEFTAVASDPNEAEPDGTIDCYAWDWGDGSPKEKYCRPDLIETATHSFAAPGDYEVTLSVWDNDGIETQVKKTITVIFFTLQWQRTFDNIRYGSLQCGIEPSAVFNQVEGEDMVATLDNGFAIAGHSVFCFEPGTYGRYDPWLMKADDRGIFLWEEDFTGFGGGDGENRGAAVGIDNDGDGFIVTGFVGWGEWDYHPDGKDLWVARTTAEGSPEWFKTFDNGYADEGRGITTLADGYLIAGYQFTDTFSSTTYSRGWLLKLDQDGNAVAGFDTVFPDDGLFFNTITPLGDDDFLLTGGYKIFSYGREPLPLYSVKSDGTVNWFNTWTPEPEAGSYAFNEGYWATPTPDGGFAVAGSLGDNMCLIKTGSPDGDDDFISLLPEIYNFKTDDEEAIYSGVMTEDGGYLLGGMYHDDISRDYDFHLIRLDKEGNELWREKYNEGADPYCFEYPRAIVALPDGSYVIMVSRVYDIHRGHTDVWLVKLGQGSDPIAAFEADPVFGPLSGIAPLDVQFTDMSSSGTAPYEYAWDFGDGETSEDQNPAHTYTITGTYTVSLTITDVNDKTDTYTRDQYIVVRPPFLIADIDEDGDADGRDLYLLLQAMGSIPGFSNWNSDADLDGNGMINGDDIDDMADYFGGLY